jgi:serine protease AprX
MMVRSRTRWIGGLVAGVLAWTAVAAAGAPRAHAAEAAVPPSLLEQARANPARTFDVIVRAVPGTDTDRLSSLLDLALDLPLLSRLGVTQEFSVIDGVAARLTGVQLLTLSQIDAVATVTPDDKVVPSGPSNPQLWPQITGAASLWGGSGDAPAIAVVDSGVDASRADFGGRVVKQVDLTRGSGANSPGDGFGHGTFVASLAAGGAAGHTGFAPGAPIVSLDVFDDQGRGTTSDVLAAADWILRHRSSHAVRVANFSLIGSRQSSFVADPLNLAVQRLWLSGVVVVAAAGNYGGADAPSGVLYPPGNDPFVITVGAADVNGTVPTGDDFAAPWSAHGPTPDGFAKPELGAPGRQMHGAVPTTASMYVGHPERVVGNGYMWMSGTSFAAPLVAGAAAQILAEHPAWTPDDVKGALMVSAAPTAAAADHPLGVGELQAARAAAVADPPNPNLALNRFVVAGARGKRFDGDAWASEARSNASWSSASWSSASWSSASWSSASWSSASWSSASWSSASWSSGAAPDGSTPAAANPMWLP